jgi:hypothetical protein
MYSEGSTNFSFQTQFLQFFLNFQEQNPLKNQYLAHLRSKNCEIDSIKSDFLIIQKCPEFLKIKFNCDFYLIFIEKWFNNQ